MIPNTPEQVWVGSKEYSWRMDWATNGWLILAAVTSGLGDIMFSHLVREAPVTIQWVVAALPFAFILLWARALSRWIAGMDELHRRITISAVLFAVSATLFVIMLWHRLDKAGLFQAMFPATGGTGARWDIATVGHGALLLTLFYGLGHARFAKRYL